MTNKIDMNKSYQTRDDMTAQEFHDEFRAAWRDMIKSMQEAER